MLTSRRPNGRSSSPSRPHTQPRPIYPSRSATNQTSVVTGKAVFLSHARSPLSRFRESVATLHAARSFFFFFCFSKCVSRVRGFFPTPVFFRVQSRSDACCRLAGIVFRRPFTLINMIWASN